MRYLFFSLLFVATLAAAAVPPGTRDGEVRMHGESMLVWDGQKTSWLSADQFWTSFAERRRGRIWPASGDFPPFAEVREHDTFLYRHETGPCLMYFFHNRWRRANDVWRWDARFNSYGGCANVFGP